MNPRRQLAFYAIAGLLLAATAIASVNFLALPTLRAQSGTIVFSVADTPPSSSNVSKLYLTIDQVMIHREDNESANDTHDWITVAIPAKTFELLSLRNITEHFPQIGTAKLAAGTYNLIWFHVADAKATIGGQNETVRVPSDWLKIPMVRFAVSDGGVTNILIDIGYGSIRVNKELILRPVAHVLSQ